MSADRELLELAAKAIGENVIREADDGNGLLLEGVQNPWNPLDDDGDSRRLQVALKLDVEFTDESVWANGVDVQNYQLFEWHKDDKCAATRLAVLRAAAVIGRAMP